VPQCADFFYVVHREYLCCYVSESWDPVARLIDSTVNIYVVTLDLARLCTEKITWCDWLRLTACV
jgi:hypothetical protein